MQEPIQLRTLCKSGDDAVELGTHSEAQIAESIIIFAGRLSSGWYYFMLGTVLILWTLSFGRGVRNA